MSFATSRPIQYRLYGDSNAASGEQPYQVLQLRLRYVHRLIAGSPSVGVPYRILHETAPAPLDDLLFPLPLRELPDPVFFQIYVEELLSSVGIRAAAREVMARQIASYVFGMAGGDREMNFLIVAVVNNIQQTWMMEANPEEESNGGAVGEETVILEEAARPARRRGVAEWAMERLRKEKLEENENGEELGDCSICLDEMNCNCKKKEVIKIPCGHAYHHSCISKWFHNHNSCPLCRSPLPLED